MTDRKPERISAMSPQEGEIPITVSAERLVGLFGENRVYLEVLRSLMRSGPDLREEISMLLTCEIGIVYDPDDDTNRGIASIAQENGVDLDKLPGLRRRAIGKMNAAFQDVKYPLLI